ncbi:MAG: hypothetical protein ACYTKD_21100 [Planctomycetota bacterium]|jgi:hypothetical protein
MTQPHSEPPPLRRVFCAVFLAANGLVAVLWLALTPHGFPFAHARFWVNGVLPVAAVGLVAAGIAMLWKRRDTLPRALVMASFFLWLTTALVGRIVFPVSFRWLALVMGMVAAAQGRWAYRAWAGLGRRRTWLAGTFAPAAGVATLIVLSQRAGAPDTRPLNAPLPTVRGEKDIPGTFDELAVGGSARVAPGRELVECEVGGLDVTVWPLLTFHSRSPDRCWTALSPWRERVMPRRRLFAWSGDADTRRFAYEGEYRSTMEVGREADARAVRIETHTALPGPVFSHLNSACQLAVGGAERPFLSFSPCPAQRIEVLPSDYPVGRPARIAYLGADGAFRVFEASSGEKGPFRELASGELAGGQPLQIVVHDGDRPACRVVLDDWAAQAGTALSPTAGWGLPVNAIEFRLVRAKSGATAYIFVTLAGTSVGRGWDSVGHAAGTYRNRMRIEGVTQTSLHRPAFFCAGMAIELALKASLRCKGKTEAVVIEIGRRLRGWRTVDGSSSP